MQQITMTSQEAFPKNLRQVASDESTCVSMWRNSKLTVGSLNICAVCAVGRSPFSAHTSAGPSSPTAEQVPQTLSLSHTPHLPYVRSYPRYQASALSAAKVQGYLRLFNSVFV
jgi:hypothetical protein